MDDGVSRIASGKEDFKIWVAPSRLFCELATIHLPRQPDIREQDGSVGMLFEFLKSPRWH